MENSLCSSFCGTDNIYEAQVCMIDKVLSTYDMRNLRKTTCGIHFQFIVRVLSKQDLCHYSYLTGLHVNLTKQISNSAIYYIQFEDHF